MLASTNPAVLSYDPAYAYELAHIVRAGIDRMYGGTHPDPNVMVYLTVYNEPIVQPAEPEGVDVDGIVKGIHLLQPATSSGAPAQILASGVGVPWALEAQELLAGYGVAADVWSVTSWTELRRDGLRADEHNLLHPLAPRQTPYLTAKLADARGPFVGVSDYSHTVPDLIRPYVPGDYATLGADDYGFSDTRAAARRYFFIDGPSIAVRVLASLAQRGELDPAVVAKAIEDFRLFDVTAGTSGNAGGES